MAIKKVIGKKPKMSTGGTTDPGIGDKVKLAAKRIGRNINSRVAMNQFDKADNAYKQGDKEKFKKFLGKADASLDKAYTKNKDIKSFKREEGFAPGGDNVTVTKPGEKFKRTAPIFSKLKKGGTVTKKKKK